MSTEKKAPVGSSTKDLARTLGKKELMGIAIGQIIGADSIGFLSLEACDKLAVGSRCGFCKACFSGEYPVKPPKAGRKLKFETRLSEKE